MSFPVASAAPKPVNRPAVQAGPAFPKSLFDWPAYLKATAEEWKRISWPNQLQVVGLTALVVVIVGAITLILWGMDNAFRVGIHFITPH